MLNKNLLLISASSQTIPLPDPPDDQHDWIVEKVPEGAFAYVERSPNGLLGFSESLGFGIPLVHLSEWYIEIFEDGPEVIHTTAKIVYVGYTKEDGTFHWLKTDSSDEWGMLSLAMIIASFINDPRQGLFMAYIFE